MQYSVVFAALVGAVAAQSSCVDKCNTDYNSCRVGVNANRAQCAAEYSECLGYVPFSNGTLVTPTACSSSASSTAPVVYTTKVVTELTTFCPAATTLTFNNNTYTVTSATTLTIKDCPCTITTPVAPAPVKPTTTAAPVYTTEVVTAITTYCPAATTIVVGNTTIPVTAATTLTVPCPGGCTITTPVPAAGTPAANPPAAVTPAVTVPANGTSTATPTKFTGAAGMVKPAMALLALAGAAVLL